MKTIPVSIYNNSNNSLPVYETSQSAGVDIRADFSRITPTNLLKVFGDSEFIFEPSADEQVKDRPALLRLEPGSRALIPTGLFVAIPNGYELEVRPRSGLAIKKGITVLNTPGCIDPDYRGEVGVILINHGLETVWIEDGERIAQLILKEVPQIEWNVVNSKQELGKTDRLGGFGHTGNK